MGTHPQVTVRLSGSLRDLAGGAADLPASGATVALVLDDLGQRYPGLRDRVLGSKGVRRFLNIYVGAEDIRFLDGLATPLRGGESISIIPAFAGG